MDFQKEIIDRSFEKPIVVDFWAPWCGPCRALGPILETIAQEQLDRITLVKINTEEYPELAQQFQIYSIPHVKLFIEGKIVDEFSGALPKSQIETWLDKNIPTETNFELSYLLENQNGLPDSDLVQKLSLWINDNPDNQEARLELAKHLVFVEPASVEDVTGGISFEKELLPQIEAVQKMAEFQLMDLDNGHPAGLKLLNAQTSFTKGNLVLGIEQIIDAVSLDKSYQEDLPRLAGIAFFNLIGTQHPITKSHRKLFDMMIW